MYPIRRKRFFIFNIVMMVLGAVWLGIGLDLWWPTAVAVIGGAAGLWFVTRA